MMPAPFCICLMLLQALCENKQADLRRPCDRVQVNFAYKEAGEHKQALVKLRLCPKHALQLNHKQNHKLIKKRKREQQDVQNNVSKRPVHSHRTNTSTGPKGKAGPDALDGPEAQLLDAVDASKASDLKHRHSQDHGVFDGLFD